MDRRIAVLALGVFCGAATGAAASTRTITGRVVYGTINSDIGEDTPPTRFLAPGMPIVNVRVEFNDGASLPVGDADVTDLSGRFSITFNGTPNITLVTKARNDYVTVKKHMGFGQNLLTDDALKTRVDISSRVDYNTCLDGDTCDIGTVTVVSDAVDSFTTHNGDLKNYVSRAFYMAGAAQASGSHVAAVNGAPLPGEKVVVRLGTAASTPGWYYQIDNTIYLGNDMTLAFWHEYGHFVEDKIGAFALLPPYLGPGHGECSEITDAGNGNTDPNLCWAYLEGLATWFATLDAAEAYGGYVPMTTAFDADGNLATVDGPYDMEDGQCSQASIDSWTEPRAVESVVANVLWDLVDDVQDPDNGSGVDEVADATPEEVVAVMTASTGVHTTCSPLELNSHPMGLVEFWDEWRNQHPGIVPDLYAAYAFNGADLGTTDDLLPPGPVTLASTSHVEGAGVWSNNHTVSLTITDGADDVSGSYKYFFTVDQTAGTPADTSGTPAFKSKLTVNAHDVELPDGVNQYIHANTLDMAGHAGTASTDFGPVSIDTVNPYMTAAFSVIPFRIDPLVPSADPTLMLGYPAQITWGSHDDLSGVASVHIFFSDPVSGFSLDLNTTPQESGSFTWLVRDVPVTTTGRINIVVTDRAGNGIVRWVAAPVVAPFLGPVAANLGADADPCQDARVISGDLNRDGFDDVVMVCRFNATGHLYVFSGSAAGLVKSQDFAWRPADDLAGADLDRDGDLDVVTVSLDAPGNNTEAEILYNDGTGTLVDPGIALPLGPLDRKTVRVIRPYDVQQPVIAVFGVLPGPVPAVRAYSTLPGFPAVALAVDPVDGDWEAADMNADGYTDLVALGVDGASTPALTVFAGGPGSAWTRQDAEVYGGASEADVDLGDFNADGRPDVLVEFDDGAGARVSKMLSNTAAGYPLFAAASISARRVAGGDGFIIDTANDAKGEPVCMGSDAAGVISGWYLRNDNLVGLLEDTTVQAMVPLAGTDSAWGDFDADGDLDMFQAGRDAAGGFHIAYYFNQLGNYIDHNNAPRPPVNLSATYDAVRGGYTFSWAAPPISNDETPVGGFGYELRVGTTTNGNQILSWVHPAGASQQGNRLSRFVQMPVGTYYFDVRTVDTGWRRSVPAGVKKTVP